VRAPRLLTALAVPVLLLTACGDAGDDGDGPGATDEQPEELDADELEEQMAAEQEELSERPPAEVDLLDAGDEPLAPLRLTLAEGDELATTLTITSEQLVEGVQEEGAPISQTVEVAFTVSEVDDGLATVDFEFTDASTEGLPEGQPDQDEQLVGLRGRMVLDERARLVAATPTARGLDEVLIPFPEEEVGPGATWEVVTERNPELPVGETLSVELVAFEGDEYEVRVSTASEELDEPVEQESAPGQRVTVEELVLSGEGEVRGSLAEVFPTTATLENETMAVLDLGPEMGGEQTQRTRSEITVGR
jgi:hypothetical protein